MGRKIIPTTGNRRKNKPQSDISGAGTGVGFGRAGTPKDVGYVFPTSGRKRTSIQDPE